MTKREKVVNVVPFELLSEEKARGRTPFGEKLFREHFGHLYHAPKKGRKGGYLATDLQAAIEAWPIESRDPRDRQ
ncbi:hypothetical protein [Bifidobacterium xylocopae]|uniref:Uncharacterized protein n=1 Tax=Bifidobacterium xylocopae TaxID=2493119 RepID=A0A366KFS0_9BIFI|nr:hypothetical protein [Bifidobacterium xylocopae]RBQ00039.1 hypothetical protein CRD59_00830 [Bifidobacterium xylocopae]